MNAGAAIPPCFFLQCLAVKQPVEMASKVPQTVQPIK